MISVIEWFSEQLTEVERKNHINNRILPISKNSLKQISYNKILKEAKDLEIKQAHDYAKFAIECDRRGMKILNFDDWLKL